jgi:hypothetical protein
MTITVKISGSLQKDWKYFAEKQGRLFQERAEKQINMQTRSAWNNAVRKAGAVCQQELAVLISTSP